MKRIYYYSDELNDDFAGTHITAKKLPADYKYVRTDGKWKAARFFVYKLFATPIILFAGLFTSRIKNKKVLKGYKKGGALEKPVPHKVNNNLIFDAKRGYSNG